MMDDLEDLRDVGAELKGPPRPGDAELIGKIQRQLVLLIHTLDCQQREYEDDDIDDDEVSQCTMPHCRTLKEVVNHMIFCQEARNCTVPHCSTSAQLIVHWKNCHKKNECRVCCLSKPKEWHKSLTCQQRIHAVDLVLEILVSSRSSIILGRRVPSKNMFAKKIENNLYEKAESLAEYYRTLAEKMRALEMGIKERRNRAR